MIPWFAGTNDSSTKHLMFQVIFLFHNFLQKFLQKPFQFIYDVFYKFTKKSFECPKSIENYKEINAWNIRRLDDESFVLKHQRTRVLYCRLTGFKKDRKQLRRQAQSWIEMIAKYCLEIYLTTLICLKLDPPKSLPMCPLEFIKNWIFNLHTAG